MKKNIISVVLLALLVVLFILFIPKSTFAEENKKVNKIDITIQNPIIGNKLSTDWQVTVEGVDSSNVIQDYIEWQSEDLKNVTSDIAESGKKYRADLSFKISKDYVLSDDCKAYINGTKVSIVDYIEDTNYDSIHIFSDLFQARVQKEISKIEMIIPELVIGEKLCTDISKIQVKIDDNENLDVTNVKWLSEDLKDLSNDIIEAGKKYRAQVDFNVPNKYGVSSNVIITVNGDQVHFKNMSSYEFNYATLGDKNYDYASVISNPIEAKDNIDENKQENNTKATKTIKNPKTGDTIVKVIIISVLSMIGIAYIINSIRKQNI